MSASETAFYLSLNPISVSDYERIFMARSGPKLRIRLSMQSTLEMVATNLVDRALAARRDGGLRVELFVKSRAEYVKLPLCLAVSEYLAMTNQGREGNVWYRCKDDRESRVAHSQPEPLVFHSGLSMYSNSFGAVVPAAADDEQATDDEQAADGLEITVNSEETEPGPTAAEAALDRGWLYVLEEEGQVAATAILNQEQLPEYRALPWSIPAGDEQVFVIHTLCVPPSRSGRGLARTFVAFAEALGREKGCAVMRLDTYEGNQPALAMYPRLGYRTVGKTLFHFHGLIWEDLVCFEKQL